MAFTHDEVCPMPHRPHVSVEACLTENTAPHTPQLPVADRVVHQFKVAAHNRAFMESAGGACSGRRLVSSDWDKARV